MTAMLTSVSKTVNKFSTKGSGILSDSASGIGTNRLMRYVDNAFLGGRIQSIGIPVPFLGSVDLIDGFNYLVHAGGKTKISKKGIIAVSAAKVEQGVFPLIPNLNILPSGGSSPSGSPATGVQSAGAGF